MIVWVEGYGHCVLAQHLPLLDFLSGLILVFLRMHTYILHLLQTSTHVITLLLTVRHCKQLLLLSDMPLNQDRKENVYESRSIKETNH